MKKSARQIAQNVINRIYNDITAKSIIRSLQQNLKIKNNSNIKVEVDKGIANLTGEVADWEEYHEAFETAHATVGVVDVKSDLAINDQPSSAKQFDEKNYAAWKPLSVAE